MYRLPWCKLFYPKTFDLSKVTKYNRLPVDTQNYRLVTLKANVVRMAGISAVSPPGSVKGMTVLDCTKFEKEADVIALKVDESEIHKVAPVVKTLMLTNLKKVKPIQSYGSGCKIVLLAPSQAAEITTAEELLSKLEALQSVKFELISHSLQLSYENWSAEEIFKAVLPDNLSVVSGFTVAGHVAHLNLKESHLPYKYLIGQVLLDKHANLKTVVNKTDNIDSTYRNFQLEVLAGLDDLMVTVKENGCAYEFDFSKVYWNSRLGTEHERIVKEISSDAIVYDMFAGVGPFSVPAAKCGATVYANDLNPESYKHLCNNMIKNKVKGKFKTYNMDGRDFVREVIKSDIIDRVNSNNSIVIIMNLPALAIEFLDSFIGLLENCSMKIARPPPTVYCYCFSKAKESSYEDEVANRANEILGIPGFITPTMCRRVRNVAPNKEMMCIKFSLHWNILLSNADTLKAKRLKLDEL